YIEDAGNTTFYINANSGGWLLIDGEVVVEDNTSGGMTEVSGTVNLTAGWHTIEVIGYNETGLSGIIVSYDPVGNAPDQQKQVIPEHVLLQELPENTRITTYDAAGQVIATTDALGRTTTYEYDDLGRLVKTTLPDPDGVGGEDAPEYETEYSKVGNVLREIDALGNVTTYEY